MANSADRDQLAYPGSAGLGLADVFFLFLHENMLYSLVAHLICTHNVCFCEEIRIFWSYESDQSLLFSWGNID